MPKGIYPRTAAQLAAAPANLAILVKLRDPATDLDVADCDLCDGSGWRVVLESLVRCPNCNERGQKG